MVSPTLEPLKASVSKPVWPSTVSLPSPGFQMIAIVAGAEQRDVVAAAAGDDVVAVAADQHVVAATADDGVIAGATVDGEVDRTEGERGGVDGVVAVEAVNDERVVGGFGTVDGHLGRAVR